MAHAVEAELKRVPGTREVATLGGPGRVVQVLLDNEQLASRGIAAADLRRALLGANAGLPAGRLVRDNRSLLVETGGFFATADDIRGLVVGVADGAPVYLADVARVVDGPPPAERYVWHGAGAADARRAGETFPAVTIQVTKKAGENAVDVARRIEARMAELANTVIPQGVEVTVTRDYGRTADDKARLLITKLLFATLSVVALVFLALGRREAVIVGAAVILTLAATLFASWAWGFTLNRVSLFALIFSIGILVDDAIVVVENIHRHRALHPSTPLFELIPRAVDEVGGPTILATLTVIAALLPMAFVTGLMGPYMSPIPINASMGMLISLAIAFVVTPWLALRLAPQPCRGPRPLEARRLARRNLCAPAVAVRGRARRRAPPRAARHRRRRRHPRLRVARGGPARRAQDAAVRQQERVPGRRRPAGRRAGRAHRRRARRARGGRRDGAGGRCTSRPTPARPSPINFNGLVRQYDLRREPEQGDLQVNLVDRSQRAPQEPRDRARAASRRSRRSVRGTGRRVKVVEVPPGPPVMSPIVAEIYGPDEAGRHALAKRVRQALAETPHVVGLDDSIEDAAPRALVRVDQRKAAIAGVTRGRRRRRAAHRPRPARTSRACTTGRPSTGSPSASPMPPEQQRLDRLLATPVRGASGATVPLAELVDVREGQREKTRYRKDLLPGHLRRAPTSPAAATARSTGCSARAPPCGRWTCRTAPRSTSASSAAPSDPYRSYALKWDGEWQVTYETFRDMGIAYAVGLVLIYLLVVAQFGSYLTPLVIMAPIPLTIIGVMPGHALLGQPFTATSMIGMIALAGIIVRNSILLVDFVEPGGRARRPGRRRPSSTPRRRARSRSRSPASPRWRGALFILDDPIFNGLAIALVFGILVSTLLTLVVIPVLYYVQLRHAAAAQPSTRSGARPPMTIERLIRIFAGTLRARLPRARRARRARCYHSANWLWFTAFVGANLLQSGFTGFCPLATILRRLGVRPGPA